MFKRGLSAIICAIIFQTGAMAQIYVKNTGVGVGVINPNAKLEVADAQQSSFRVGITSNVANSTAQIRNSLTVVADDLAGNSSCGAVASDYYNNGNNPTWSGTLLLYHGLNQSGTQYGISAKNQGTLLFQNVNNGVIASNGANIHIFPYIGSGTTPAASFLTNGNVGIGVANPGYKLQVAGTVFANNFLTSGHNYPDYVFDSTYVLRTLQSVESYIKQNHHLPEVPSLAEIKIEGINLGQQQEILLKKVEELTLYAIEQDKKQQEQNKKLLALEQKLIELMEANNKLQEELLTVKSKNP